MKRTGWMGRVLAVLACCTGCAAPGADKAGGPELPAGAKFFRSHLNEERGAPPEPILLFGTAAFLGDLIADNSTFHAVGVQTVADLEAVVAQTPCIGLLAGSPRGEAGAAGRAIRAFRASKSAGEFVFYLPATREVEIGAVRAVEYGADALMMSPMEGNELLQSILAVLRRVKTGVPRPTTVAQHVALLRELLPTSFFWELQGLPPEAYKEGMYVDPEREY